MQHCLYYTVLTVLFVSVTSKCTQRIFSEPVFVSAVCVCMVTIGLWRGGSPVRGTRLEATPIVKQLSDAKSVCARLVQCGPVWSEGVGEVNQTVEQTEAVANLSPHLGGYVGIVFTGDFVYQLFYLRTLSIYLLLIFFLVKHFFEWD